MSADIRLPGPLEFTGSADDVWPAPAMLVPGAPVVACYAVLEVGPPRPGRAGVGVELSLTEARGRVDAWLPAALPAPWLRSGIYVGVRGLVEDAARPRIHVEEITPIRVSLDELDLFLPRTKRDPAELDAELASLVASVRDDALRELLVRLLGPETEVGRGFRLAPAATRNHHAWLGGLLEHTVSVATMCDAAAAHYGRAVDRDLLVTAALLHDIGKVREIGAQAGFPYTGEGKLLGHILLGLRMVSDEARTLPLDAERVLLLEHLIASHQGRYEWQSPREPRVLEALILHYLDDLDAKLHHAIEAIDAVDLGWTAWDRSLGRELLRHIPPPDPESDAGAGTADTAVKRPRAKRAQTARNAKKKRASARKGSRSKKRSSRADRAMPTDGAGAAGSPTRSRPPGHPGFIDRDTLDLFG